MLHQVGEAVEGLRTPLCSVHPEGTKSGHLSLPAWIPQPQTKAQAAPPRARLWAQRGPPAGVPPLCPKGAHHMTLMGDSERGARASLGLVAEHGQHKISRLAEALAQGMSKAPPWPAAKSLPALRL